MGRDKALIGDPPWAHRVAAALSAAGCEPVTLLGGDPALAHDRWTHRGDEHPGAGPGAALLHAARCAGRGPMVVAACDLPSLRRQDVSNLLKQLDSGAGAAAYRLAGRPQWSLIALSGEVVAQLAGTGADPGVPLHVLLDPVAELCDPPDSGSVTDFDHPPAGKHGLTDC